MTVLRKANPKKLYHPVRLSREKSGDRQEFKGQVEVETDVKGWRDPHGDAAALSPSLQDTILGQADKGNCISYSCMPGFKYCR